MASLCLLVLLAVALPCSAQRRLIGTLPNRQHGISGTLYAEGDRTFVIEGFSYDGLGPDAFIYVYEKGVTVSRFGSGLIVRLPGTDDGKFVFGRSYSNERLTVSLDSCTECRAGLTIRDLQTFTIWCRGASAFFTRFEIPADLFDQAGDAVLTYDNCESLSDELQVSWTVDQMEDRVFFQLCGCVDASDYMAFGLSGSDSAVQMVGADAVVTWHDSEGTGAVDYYLSARAQCRPNRAGGTEAACPDDVQGGVNNINATVLRGRQEGGGGRCVEYVRPLSASDAVLDRAITPNSAQYIVWAVGPRGTEDGFAYFHTRWLRDRQTTLQFGRTAEDNCAALSCFTPPSCPYPQQTFDVRNMNATFVAEIGQSGGLRGYKGITGNPGWGIAWYLNSTLIPVIRATRGNTYTFLIYGGSNSSNAGKYHPFYISDSIAGGRLANTPEERSVETVYAGFDNETVTAIGPLCEHQSTSSSGPVNVNCDMTFQDYFNTLNLTCDGTRITDAGVLVWTPDEDTPDIVYYQCATHVNLGWQIDLSGAPHMMPSAVLTPHMMASALLTLLLSVVASLFAATYSSS